jgi:hypothetical protein
VNNQGIDMKLTQRLWQAMATLVLLAIAACATDPQPAKAASGVDHKTQVVALLKSFETGDQIHPT